MTLKFNFILGKTDSPESAKIFYRSASEKNLSGQSVDIPLHLLSQDL